MGTFAGQDQGLEVRIIVRGPGQFNASKYAHLQLALGHIVGELPPTFLTDDFDVERGFVFHQAR